MAHILIMPRQGNTVESCIITDWKVREGDQVTAETIICEVETDKASFEIPAEAAGTVLKLMYEAGDDVPVLKPIAVIGEAGEVWEKAISQESSHGDTETQRNEELGIRNEELGMRNEKSSSLSASHFFVSPRARNLAAKEALSLEMVSGTGPDGRIIERDVEESLRHLSPLTAAAKAAGAGAVPQQGTGIGGRITVADLAASSDPTAAPDAHSSFLIPNSSFTETQIKGIRKIIAERMYRSLAESAQFTLNASAPASKLLEIRSAVKTQTGIAKELGLLKVSINDLILFAVARTLPEFLYMNAHKIGNTIRTFQNIHLAAAVDTPRGLMVPVIRNADGLSLAEISAEANRLAAACQAGNINPDELSGSTFTVSNLGSFGVTSFTPILNAPEVAILGVCSIEMKPTSQPLTDCLTSSPQSPGPIILEPYIGFSLTINHEAVDGAPAARFLQKLCEAVAKIDNLLTSDSVKENS